MYLLPLNATLREIRMVNFVMCHFTIIKNWGEKNQWLLGTKQEGGKDGERTSDF